MNAYELADDLENSNGLQYITKVGLVSLSAQMLRQQADRIERKRELIREQTALLVKQNNRIAELEKELQRIQANAEFELDRTYTTPQIKELSDEENNLKWWISSFEHLKALGGGISDEMETKLKEMKARLKKASEK